MIPVSSRLIELARSDGILDTQCAERDCRPVVLATNLRVSAGLPTFAPLPVLWSPFLENSGITMDESKERCYQFMYYTSVDGEKLSRELKEMNVSYRSALFGHERVSSTITKDFKPITIYEIDAEVRRYQQYAASFTHKHAARPILSYVITLNTEASNLSNLDRCIKPLSIQLTVI